MCTNFSEWGQDVNIYYGTRNCKRRLYSLKIVYSVITCISMCYLVGNSLPTGQFSAIVPSAIYGQNNYKTLLGMKNNCSEKWKVLFLLLNLWWNLYVHLGEFSLRSFENRILQLRIWYYSIIIFLFFYELWIQIIEE